MKTLIAYYSWSGNNEALAKELAGKLGADLEKITEKGSRSEGAFGFMLSGFQGFFKLKAGIRPAVKDPEDYDLVVLCAPVWAGGISSPMRSYVSQNRKKFKRIAFASVSGDENNPKALADLEKTAGMKVPAALVLSASVTSSGSTKDPKDAVKAKLTSADLKNAFFQDKIDVFVEKLSG